MTDKPNAILVKAQAFLEDKECIAYLGDYLNATRRAAGRSGWDPAGLVVTDAVAVGAFFQYLWEELPDSPAIRRKPFWMICDIAELYCFGAGE